VKVGRRAARRHEAEGQGRLFIGAGKTDEYLKPPRKATDGESGQGRGKVKFEEVKRIGHRVVDTKKEQAAERVAHEERPQNQRWRCWQAR